ncbi:MAG: WG repeat-containing protein, partial [Bacteroidetes bacterium]|nr:WG repeat-containing protein [Bacteroidota bacterium]
IYDDAYPFINGLAKVIKEDKYGFINVKGEEVIPLEYDFVEDFHQGLAVVKKDEYFGLIDSTNRLVLDLSYESIGDECEGLRMVMKNNKYGFIDHQANIVIPMLYQYKPDVFVKSCFSNGVCVVRKNDKYGIINAKDQLVLPFKFTNLSNMSQGIIAAKYSNWGYVNQDNKTIYKFILQEAHPFSDGMGRVKRNNKYGFVNKEGRLQIDFQYDNATDFKNGYSIVKQNGLSGLLFISDVIILPIEFNEIEYINKSLIKVMKNNKMGYYQPQKRTFLWKEEGAEF